MTGKTGQKCVSAGKYHCQTHTLTAISMKVGDTFPKCNFGGPRWTRYDVGERRNDLIGTQRDNVVLCFSL
jgi:hypothetical protein